MAIGATSRGTVTLIEDPIDTDRVPSTTTMTTEEREGQDRELNPGHARHTDPQVELPVLVALAIEADEDAVATTQVLVEVELDHEAGTNTQTESQRDALAMSERPSRGQRTSLRPNWLLTNRL